MTTRRVQRGPRAWPRHPTGGGAIDEETGTAWNLHGSAVEGELAGASLAFVESHVSKWYVRGAPTDPGIDIAGPHGAERLLLHKT